MKPLRILHITDLHLSDIESPKEKLRVGFYKDFIEGLARRIASQSPTIDYLVLTGDFVDKGKMSNFKHVNAIVDYMVFCLKPSQVAVCIGNHDVNRKLDEKKLFNEARKEVHELQNRYVFGAEVKATDFYKLYKNNDHYLLSFDSTFGSNGSNLPSELTDSQIDGVVALVREKVPNGSLLLVLSHYPMVLEPDVDHVIEVKGWIDDHLWKSGKHLYRRISDIRDEVQTIWLFGDGHVQSYYPNGKHISIMGGMIGGDFTDQTYEAADGTRKAYHKTNEVNLVTIHDIRSEAKTTLDTISYRPQGYVFGAQTGHWETVRKGRSKKKSPNKQPSVGHHAQLIHVDAATAQQYIDKIDIIIITANYVSRGSNAEWESFKKKVWPLPDTNTVVSTTHDDLTYYLGRLGSFRVAYVHAQHDWKRTSEVVHKAVDFIKPKLIIIGGIAFGLNPGDQRKGDVLVSRTIVNYEVVKNHKNEIEVNQIGEASLSGKSLFTAFANNWDWEHKAFGNKNCQVYCDDMLSTNQRTGDLAYRNLLKNKFEESLGAEMEGAGLSHACVSKECKEWIVVKSIWDWADGKGDKHFQRKAALASMSLIDYVLTIKGVFSGQAAPIPPDDLLPQNTKYKFDPDKGGPLWMMNRVRSSALSKLITDFEAVNNIGYPEEVSAALERDLKTICDEVSNLPDSYKGADELKALFGDFLEKFSDWRKIQGSEKSAVGERRKILLALKNIRAHISLVIRDTQVSLGYNIGEVNTEKIVELQKELCREYPDLFQNLSSALKQIDKGVQSNPVDRSGNTGNDNLSGQVR